MALNFTAADRVGGIGGYIGGISALLAILGGMAGGQGGGPSENDRPVSRYELNLVKESMAKDSEIAVLKSDQNTEVKIADVYERLITRVNADKTEQAAVNAAQAVYNATNSAAVGVINSQVQQLMGLTKLVVPATSICPEPMPAKNSWTAPTAAAAG